MMGDNFSREGPMSIHPTSVLLGLGLAWALPVLGRALRPVAVQAAATGMQVLDEVRRIVAEQAEMIEDIAAEARARHAATNGAIEADEGGEAAAEAADEAPASDRSRRRTNGAAVRRRAS
jgi:hypothetical protein